MRGFIVAPGYTPLPASSTPVSVRFGSGTILAGSGFFRTASISAAVPPPSPTPSRRAAVTVASPVDKPSVALAEGVSVTISAAAAMAVQPPFPTYDGYALHPSIFIMRGTLPKRDSAASATRSRRFAWLGATKRQTKAIRRAPQARS